MDVPAGLGRKGKKQKNKGRKVGRNYRWEYTTHSTTKYRARHNIGPGPRKNKKLQDR